MTREEFEEDCEKLSTAIFKSIFTVIAKDKLNNNKIPIASFSTDAARLLICHYRIMFERSIDD